MRSLCAEGAGVDCEDAGECGQVNRLGWGTPGFAGSRKCSRLPLVRSRPRRHVIQSTSKACLFRPPVGRCVADLLYTTTTITWLAIAPRFISHTDAFLFSSRACFHSREVAAWQPSSLPHVLCHSDPSRARKYSAFMEDLYSPNPFLEYLLRPPFPYHHILYLQAFLPISSSLLTRLIFLSGFRPRICCPLILHLFPDSLHVGARRGRVGWERALRLG